MTKAAFIIHRQIMAQAVSFSWPHGGGRVQLAGSFTSWQPVDMIAEQEGIWRKELQVPVGRHEFKFIVDGNWVHDSTQTHAANEVGNHNNVIEVADPSEEKDELVNISSKTSNIEVERKFLVPENFSALLSECGFAPVSELNEKLVDEYFDTQMSELLRGDHWLRKRNGDWELKYPVGSQHVDGCTLYHETTDSNDIAGRLLSLCRSLKEAEVAQSAGLLKTLAASGALVSIARIETTRQCFRREEVNIVVDETQWGYRVGEVEICVHSKKDAPAALAKIDAVAKELSMYKLL
jgi:adenylate cyclase class IV